VGQPGLCYRHARLQLHGGAIRSAPCSFLTESQPTSRIRRAAGRLVPRIHKRGEKIPDPAQHPSSTPSRTSCRGEKAEEWREICRRRRLDHPLPVTSVCIDSPLGVWTHGFIVVCEVHAGSCWAWEADQAWAISHRRNLPPSNIGAVGGMLRRQRSCKKKHLRQILSKAVPKLSSIKLQHSGMSQDEGLHQLRDEMTD
jgi:hypothetical protein